MFANAIRPVHQPAACWLIDLPQNTTLHNCTLVPLRGGRQFDVYLATACGRHNEGRVYVQHHDGRGEYLPLADYRLLVWGASQYSAPIGPVDHRPRVLPTSYSDHRCVDQFNHVWAHAYAEVHQHVHGAWRVCLAYCNVELDPLDEQWFLYLPREGVLYVEGVDGPSGRVLCHQGVPCGYADDVHNVRAAVADYLGDGDTSAVDIGWDEAWRTCRGKVEAHIADVAIGAGR